MRGLQKACKQLLVSLQKATGNALAVAAASLLSLCLSCLLWRMLQASLVAACMASSTGKPDSGASQAALVCSRDMEAPAGRQASTAREIEPAPSTGSQQASPGEAGPSDQPPRGFIRHKVLNCCWRTS